KAWFQSPEGKPFISMGVDAIADQSYRAPDDNYYNPVKNQFVGNKEVWMVQVFKRLKQWHFNTLGCWADEDLEKKKFPYVHQLDIARGNPWENVIYSVFTDDFEKRVNENAQKALAYKDDPNLIGYFLDNELPWWGDYGWNAPDQKTLLERYAAIPLDSPDKEALKNFFQSRYANDIDQFNNVWKTSMTSFDEMEAPFTMIPLTKKQKEDANAWAGVVAERYFSVTVAAIKSVDPHHLILGVRFAGETPWEVVEACGKYCDVVSVNVYSKSGDLDQKLLDNFYAKAKRPILISEYSFSADENQSGDPNTKGADVHLPTQANRAEHLDRYAHQALNLPYLVGLHWFEWADEPPEGRFDGENCDYGLVDIHDVEYKLLTEKHTAINLLAADLHKTATALLPADFKPPLEAQYRQAEPGTQVPGSRDFFKVTSNAPVWTWGDKDHGGNAQVDLSTGYITVDFDSGMGWGCGISCNSNVPPFVSNGVVDLTGYNFLQFEVFAPLGLNFEVFLTESGAVDLAKSVNGADGESYSFPAMVGMGHWQTYKINLGDLELRKDFGNQTGNHILDLQGLSSVDFSISGNQGTGRIVFKNVEFKLK
ncbi:MAG TPA: hypothetical protein VK791_11795, partial [bacterium]|nr:hypothetical protein [bacterium]